MNTKLLKRSLLETTLKISEKCVASALMAAGVVGISTGVTAAPANPELSALEAVKANSGTVTPSVEGAIMLDIVREDRATGTRVAEHYSHASHASHASHYSSR
jgi:hypothetical protein